jgi:DNA-directed RNA polymerase subunit H (RpoH/RPB5)
LISCVSQPNNPKNRAIVLFSGKREKFAIDDVKFFFAQVDEEWRNNQMDFQTDTLVAVFVIHKNITSFAKKFMVSEHQRRNQGLLDGLSKMNFSFNVFFEVELVVNITEHEIVPKHRLLMPDEKRQLLEKYMVKEDQLPRILITDPVAKYCGLRRGDIVEILRDSETAGRYVTYRICL